MNRKIEIFLVLGIFLIFFPIIQNIFLPIQKYYIYTNISIIYIFIEILKFIIANYIISKINNEKAKKICILISLLFYYSGTNFFVLYLSYLFQEYIKNNKKNKILYISGLYAIFLVLLFFREKILSLGLNYELFFFVSILKIIFIGGVYRFFKLNKEYILENNYLKLVFNVSIIGIIINLSINVTSYSDIIKFYYYYISIFEIASIFSFIFIVIFYFYNISVFDLEVKELYILLIIYFYSNIVSNHYFYLNNKNISNNLLLLFSYLILIIYIIYLLIKFNGKRKSVIKINYYKIFVVFIFVFNSMFYIISYKYDCENKNVFVDIIFIERILYITLMGH